MKILLWHGYLLSGSGSNIYTRNVAREWRRQGHDVLCLCQEGHPEAFDFIDSFGSFDAGNETFTTSPLPDSASAPGYCTVVRPHIGDVLPVYVYDEYEGFTAKRYVDLSDEELDLYTERNVTALTTAIRSYEPDAIITGHEVMGPFIAREACRAAGASYLSKLHGSGLEYAVREQPDRYLPFAQKGLGASKVVIGGSRYMIREAASFIPGWSDRARVVNPGADIDLFVPRERSEPERPVVGFVGKLIANKGVHLLLAALGKLSRPVHCVVVGFGDLDGQLKALWRDLQEGDLESARGADPLREPLDHLHAFLSSGAADASYLRRVRETTLEFTGRLEHDPLSRVLPDFDVLVVPSILAEAFGMVAVEAAACGVLPVVPRHSGIGEVGEELERELGREVRLSYDPQSPVAGIAQVVDDLIALSFRDRRELGLRAAEVARSRWSWRRCADELLSYAAPA